MAVSDFILSLLKAGLLPLMIPKEERRAYIQMLSNYEIKAGQLNKSTGAWPDASLLIEFENFCTTSYSVTNDLVGAAIEMQKRR